MRTLNFLLLLVVIPLSSCNRCDSNKAMNKMLAIGKVQGRLAAAENNIGMSLASQIGLESGEVSELIAKQQYDQACEKADAIAKKLGVDLDAEQKDMITIEQLQKDGGKGSGTCSIADAAKKQMEVHAMIQAQVDSGLKSAELFRQFNDDTRSFAELLSTNPSKACELMEKIKAKYQL